MDRPQPDYRPALARVHHEGFNHHAAACAPGILRLIEPLLDTRGLVVEIGCGSGLLTRHLVEAGHRVIATDASPAMLDLARAVAPGVSDLRLLTLPDDPIPPADAIVAVGHPVNYLPSRDAINRALVAMADALNPGGVLAIDICDLTWAEERRAAPNLGRVTADWALVTEFSVPAPDRFVRQMAIFTRNADGSWRRDDERHDNVLVETSAIPGLLAAHGVEAVVADAFGGETLPVGLRTVIGQKVG